MKELKVVVVNPPTEKEKELIKEKIEKYLEDTYQTNFERGVRI